MNYIPNQISKKPWKKVVRGLTYIVLGAGVALNTFEFVLGVPFFNAVESGKAEVTLDDEDRAKGINNSKDLATYLSDKVISEVDNPLEYIFVGGLKFAALSYKAKN